MPLIESHLILMFHDITTMLPFKHPSIWYSGLRLNSKGSERSEELLAKSLFALFAPAKCVLRIIPLPYSTTILFSVSKAHWSLTYLGRSMVSWSSVMPGPM